MPARRTFTFAPALMLASALASRSTRAAARGLPATPPAHVVIVIMENRAPEHVLGWPAAPYINSLAAQAAVFTQSYAIAHPSQPNYLALFSGSTHGIADNRCPLTIDAPNLAQQLLDAGKSFVGYSESLPAVGYAGCSTPTGYVRKHAPWVNFPRLPRGIHQPMTAFPKPAQLERLPTVSMVVPNVQNDMHDGTVAQADAWMKAHLDAYVQWARSHHSLLILTWDEDPGTPVNRIPTLFVGPMVKPGAYAQRITHFSVLRTLQALYGLPYLGEAANATTITDIWQPALA